jgi:hypothetical protein
VNSFFIFHQHKKYLIAAFIVSALAHNVFGQNLGAVGNSKPLKISGGISGNQILYAAQGISARRNPYNYFLGGNVNFNIYEFNIPVSFNFSNQNISVQQPFNQVSLHPVYKWVTAHVGFVSMNFSPYTLSGHIFKGAGVDLAPTEKLKVSAMYGRLLRAVLPDTSNTRNQPSFARYGYGTKVTYSASNNFIELTAFRAKDDVNSLPFVPEQQNVLPQENIVLGVAGGISVFKKITAKYELANSAITTDARAESSDRKFYDQLRPLFTPRTSTSYYKAMKGLINYNGNGYGFGVGYERIDPQYKTLGAYFFNNDMENITINLNTSLLGGKANIGGNVGTQRDNLDHTKITTMRRAVGSVNLSVTPGQNLSLTITYSNFQTYTNVRSQFVKINQLTVYDNLDTLNFTQISENANASLNYTLKSSKEKRQTLFGNVSLMRAADKQASVTQNSGSQFINVNAGYSLNLTQQNLSISPTFNLSRNESLSSNSLTTGPSLSVSKTAMDKKLRITLSANANRAYIEKKFTNQVVTVRTMLSYVVKKKHNINVSLVGVDRTAQVQGLTKFKEFTGTMGYSYSF